MRFNLYAIYGLSDGVTDEQFDLSKLPFDITEGARIEAISERFRDGAFDLWKEGIGTIAWENLKRVRYGLVHRYDPNPTEDEKTGKLIFGTEAHEHSEMLIRGLDACLRLVRPMRQSAFLIHGDIRDDGSFDVRGFDTPPPDFVEVTEVQKLFLLRNQDTDDLRTYAPEFLRAMRGDFWKYRMAVHFHQLGYFQSLEWKARYLLWCAAIESIYTSHNRGHQGKWVATSRIRWFLGENTSIYAPGDISHLPCDPGLTVGQIVQDLYEMRNFIAHGDKIPDSFFTEIVRDGFGGGVQKSEVLFEAASFIIRASLLRILRDGLLNDFADAGSADAYFRARNLTWPVLKAAQRAASAGGAP